MKIKRYLALLPLTVIMAAGCTGSFFERNTNPDEVTGEHIQYDDYMFTGFRYMLQNIIPVFQLRGEIEYPSARYQVMEDLCGNIFSGYTGATKPSFTGNNLYNILSEKWYDAMFDDAYTRAMSAFRQLNEIREDYPERLAMADIAKVMVMHRVTDTYGPIPYLQISKGIIQSEYDSQEEVYNQFFEDLDQAIEILTNFHLANPDSKLLERFDDVFYGDIEKWIKLGNTLRLRLAMRVRFVDESLAKEQASAAMTNPVGVMTTSNDLARLNKYGTAWEYPLYMIQYDFNGGDSRMGATLESYMNAYEDKRREKYFTKASDGTWHGVRNGITSIQTKDYVYTSALSSIIASKEDPMLWMTPAEAYFLRAEGALYGFPDMGGTAQELYEQGIRVSFDTHGFSSEADAYIAKDTDVSTINYVDVIDNTNNAVISGAPTVKWDTGSGDAVTEKNFERIITQKYIAMFPSGQEAWSEFRRTGYPRVIPVRYNNGTGNGIDTDIQIRRLNFPSSEYQTNSEAVQKATQILISESTSANAGDNGGTKLWWDKK